MDVGCAQNVRLRSANRGNANNTWNVNASGNVNNNNAGGVLMSCDEQKKRDVAIICTILSLLDHPVDAAGVLSEYDKALREVEEATAE